MKATDKDLTIVRAAERVAHYAEQFKTLRQVREYIAKREVHIYECFDTFKEHLVPAIEAEISALELQWDGVDDETLYSDLLDAVHQLQELL